jgi:outer membrane protein TolC
VAISLNPNPARRPDTRLLAAAFLTLATAAFAQDATLPLAPSAVLTATAHFTDSIAPQPATPGAMPLSLDDAVALGLKHNLQILLAQSTEKAVRGQTLSVVNYLLPNLKASASTGTQEIDLAALGFKPASLAAFHLPPGSFNEIIKVSTTSAQLNLDETVFSMPDFYLYFAARKGANVAEFNTLNVRGGVVDSVGTQYLAALADQAQIANAQALETADEEVLRQATLSHDAGVGTNLDVLRARVQLQTQQQAIVSAQNTFAKDKIALNRLVGLPAGQELALTDTVPYAEYTDMRLDEAKRIAYERRKDLLSLQAQLEVAVRARKAIKFERVPTVAFNGFYGVLGLTDGLYHGDFLAEGTVRIPLSEEGRFRGEREVTEAQQIALRQQIDALKITIDAQIRSSLLDVQSAQELVKVARSNVDLATQELADTRDRLAAGVDDNLPVIQAQATLANAESRLVATEFQFNQAKLQLARNTGVVETSYKTYLGR